MFDVKELELVIRDTKDAQMLLRALDAWARHKGTPQDVVEHFMLWDFAADFKLEKIRNLPHLRRVSLYGRIARQIKTWEVVHRPFNLQKMKSGVETITCPYCGKNHCVANACQKCGILLCSSCLVADICPDCSRRRGK